MALLLPGAHFVSAKSATAAALITTADRRELEAMASLRGLAVAGVSDEDLRSRLLLCRRLGCVIRFPNHYGRRTKRKNPTRCMS
ncbi:MAG: hypothetical protein LKE28_00750 [Sphaerochaeta sp.]|nr:hypothetical protein [Sphaerochaeta sp.]